MGGPVADEPKLFQYPQAFVRLSVLLDDLGQDDPDEQILLPGPPVRLDVTKNHYGEADEAEITVAFDDFPFDPRIVRGGIVECFLADAGQIDEGYFSRLSPAELRKRCVFAGVLDLVHTQFDDEARTTRFTARDYTAYFLDAEPIAGEILFKKDGSKLSLLDVITDLKDQRDTTKQLEVDDVDGAAAKVYPADYMARASDDDDDDDDKNTSGWKVREGEVVWELMLELALTAGLVIYVELDKIVIRQPTTLYKGQKTDGTLVYTLGRDVSVQSFERNLGRQLDINVRVMSYDPDSGETLTATWPSVDELKQELIEAKKVNAKPVGDASKKKTVSGTIQVRPFVVRGVTDQDQLEEIAHQIHESLIHHEMEGTIKTDSLYDSNGVLCTEFRYGDPIVVALDPELDSLLVKSTEEQITTLLEAGYKRGDAEKIAEALDSLSVPFYVHQVRYEFSAQDEEGAFSLEVLVRSRQEVRAEDQSG